MRPRSILLFAFLSASLAAQTAPPSTPPPKPAEPSDDDLYEAGKAMFEQYASDEIKEQFEFPSRERWDEFATRLQGALEREDLAELAKYETEARAALTALRILPGYEDYADWLESRIDYIEGAKTVSQPPPAGPRVPIPTIPAATGGAGIPHYDLWLSRLKERPRPARADRLMPTLEAAFVAEGLSPAIAWLAEVESTMDPAARSPVGAKGLFQLMPATAQSLGLSISFPDERTDVGKSARAAARYLRTLHGKFGDWPLTFAAYNAGEGRVRRLLAARNAKTFAEIAAALPSETRMYVPKVGATIAVRSGVTPAELPAPKPVAEAERAVDSTLNI